VALAVGAGCGGEGSTSTSAEQSRAAAEVKADAEVRRHNEAVRDELARRQEEATPSPEEQRAEQTVSDFYSALGSGGAAGRPSRATFDYEAFCELMSERARAQTVHYAKVSSGTDRQWDCESAVDLLATRSRKSGEFKGVRGAEVIGVNAVGDKATATVSFGNGVATSIPLVKEDGRWVLAAVPASSGK
jgi:hypothetical protein